MKLLKIAATCACLLMGLQAQAKYTCTSPNNDEQLEVYKQITHLGDTIVVLKNEGGKSYHFGVMKKQGSLFVQKVVDFHDVDGSLAITHYPKQCGRGSCLPGSDAHISALLTIEGEQSHFNCNETFN